MDLLFRKKGLALALTVFACTGCSKDSEGSPTGPAPQNPSASAKEAPPQPEVAPSIIFLGDSLTAGYGLSESQAFPALIEERLRAEKSNLEVINAGRSGDTTSGGLARLDWYLKERINPQALVIFLGSNDAMRGVPLETMEENLKGIIEKARGFRKDLDIFLVELRTFPNMGADYGEEFQKLFSRVAEEKDVTLLDFPLGDVAGNAELNQKDGIHPNEEGTRKVAAHIWADLKRHLTK